MAEVERQEPVSHSSINTLNDACGEQTTVHHLTVCWLFEVILIVDVGNNTRVFQMSLFVNLNITFKQFNSDSYQAPE